MAIKQSDILQHNNPNLALVDSDFTKGGFRTAVAVKSDLYLLSAKVDEPSAAGQIKEHATIVYVTSENKYYVLKDVTNVGNTNGWEEFQTGGAGTITGATNGLTLAGVSGATVILGGDLTGSTIIDGLSSADFTFDNINDFQITPDGTTNVVFGVDETGILLSLSGGTPSERTVIFDNITGMRYGGDYHTSFTEHSLIDKDYADAIVSGLKPKEAVLVATTEAITLSGLTTIDTIVLQNGDRVLVKDQGGVSGNTANGVYVATGGTWNRSEDFDGTPFGEVASGSYMWVLSGDTNAYTSWVLSTPDPITIDTTPLQFVYFSHVGNVVEGHGIIVEQSGTTHIISVNKDSFDGNSLTWTGTTGNETLNVDITTGTLSTALDSKLPANTFTGYTATSVNNIESVGSGDAVYSGTSGTTAYFRSLVGSGATTITNNGDSLVFYSNTVGESQLYSGETPTAIDLGGIDAGYELTGKTVSCILQDLLIPELFQTTIQTPTTSLSAPNGICEIGCNLSFPLTPTYNAGTISPLYQTTAPYTRGGAWNAYSYTGPGTSAGFTTDASCSILHIVTSGGNTWGACSRFAEGATIYGSKGTLNPVSNNPLPSGNTAAKTCTVTGILPWYWGTSSVGTVTSDIITGGTKVLAVVTQSTPITFNALTEYLWFAAPNGITPKTRWWVAAGNESTIGTAGSIWASACSVSVTSGQGCWSNCNYDVYVTCAIASTDTGVPMCLYY